MTSGDVTECGDHHRDGEAVRERGSNQPAGPEADREREHPDEDEGERPDRLGDGETDPVLWHDPSKG